MTWLVENPMPVIYVTVLVQLILLGILVMTGRGVMLFAMVGVGALAGALLLIEYLVVTDREEIQDTLSATAAAIAANDATTVKQFIAPEDERTRNRIDQEFDDYYFESVSIKSNLKIEVTKGDPPTALATFNAVAVGGDKQGGTRGVTVPRFLKVWLRKDGPNWVITRHEDHDALDGIKKKLAEGK